MTVDMQLLAGPMLLGHLFNYALMGVLMIQVYIYNLSFRGDKILIKAFVYTVFLFDILQTCFATHFAWYIFASGWGNPAVLQSLPWTFPAIAPVTALVSLMVQFFFAWRIWILSDGNKLCILILLFIATTAVGSCVAAFFWRLTMIFELSQLDPGLTAWFVGSMACDFTITATLLFQLSSRKNQEFGNLNHILHRAIRMTIETGTLTTVAVIAELVLFLNPALACWYFLPSLLVGKLYSNSLLATLNSRSESFQGNKTENQNGPCMWPIRFKAIQNIMGTPKRTDRNNDIEAGNPYQEQNATES